MKATTSRTGLQARENRRRLCRCIIAGSAPLRVVRHHATGQDVGVVDCRVLADRDGRLDVLIALLLDERPRLLVQHLGLIHENMGSTASTACLVPLYYLSSYFVNESL